MAKLVVVRGETRGAEFALDTENMTIGSGHSCEIRLKAEGVRTSHARLDFRGGSWVIVPAAADAAVRLNGKAVEREVLKPDDEIALGDVVLRLVEGGGDVRKSSSVELPVPDLGVPSEAQAPALIAKMKEAREKVLREVRKVIVGQEGVVEEAVTALVAGGHCLLVGVPGLAKTLLVRTVAQILDLDFKRIQFTPDLMPSDITGTDVLEEDAATRKRSFHFIKGPVFTNILLADEINRTPPKTQAALLEAMQEYRVTAGGYTYPLSKPFFVLATQNPIEQEGTYPLPEAQLDRFMFEILIDYPAKADEVRIVKETTRRRAVEPERVLSGAEVLQLQEIVRQVPVSDHVANYATSLARASRPKGEESPGFVREWVAWGAGPRAGQYLVLGAKARAVLHGRFNVSCDDVRAVAPPVLRHRIFTNFNADSENVSVEDIVARLIREVPEA
jgi:MoxR-like ATPase